MEKVFEFKIYLNGIGKNKEEAWDSAIEGLFGPDFTLEIPDDADTQELEEI